MTDRERIERLERVLGTLIAWLPRELGAAAADRLHAMLSLPPEEYIEKYGEG